MELSSDGADPKSPRNGGMISVESEPGTWIKFSFTLPELDKGDRAVESHKRESDSSWRRKKYDEGHYKAYFRNRQS
jgi:hypothetical protein